MKAAPLYAGVLFMCVYTLCTSPAHAQKLPFTNYTTANGLIHNRTHIIRQDGKGYIWIGTDLGIDRYDGRSFKYFPCIERGYRSARYAAGYGDDLIFSIDFFGIAVCGGDSVRFIKLKTDKIASISGVAVINDSTCWVNNGQYGVYTVNIRTGIAGKVQMPVPIVNKTDFVDIFKDRGNNVWILSSHGLVYISKLDFRHAIEVPFFKRQYINSIRQDANGDIYVANDSGIFRYTEKSCDSIAHVTPETVLPPSGEITGFTKDQYGNMWITTTLNGLYKYDMRTKAMSNYSYSNGLVSLNTWDVFSDRENNLWIASENGISKLTTQYYTSFDISNTEYQNVKGACVVNDSTLLFTNLINAYIYVNGKVTQIPDYTNIPGFDGDLFLVAPDNKLLANIYLRDDSLYLKVVTYFYDLRNNRLTGGKRSQDLPGNIGYVYMQHHAAVTGDKMWMNSPGGLQLYEHGVFRSVPGFGRNEKKINITYITRNSKGDLWFIDNARNLARYKITAMQGSFPYQLAQQEYIEAGRLGNQYFTKAFIDSRDDIWLCGREKGVCLLHTGADGHVTTIDTFVTGTFSSDIITDVAEDNTGNIWIGTASGLDKVVFTKDSFAVQKDVYGNELCGKFIFFVKKMNDKLFVGTTGCMGVISTAGHEADIAPAVYISGLKINERNALPLLGADPELKPNENILGFTFTGISFRDEHHIKYSYKLDGLDNNWSSPSAEYAVTYTRLPPGNYTFKVRALSANDIWSAAPATFSFTITQPFYIRWWFLSLAIVTISAIVYGIYRYRINQLLEIHNIRQTISKDLHDDIGATVSSINILANMARNDLVSESRRNHFLESIQEESKHVTESLNDIVWNINPKNDTLDMMFARMQRYASELFEARNITYEFVFPQAAAEQSVDMKIRQHVYLIFKEAVNNLVKYASATKAEVVLSVSKNEFRMVITDNGKGFDTSKEHMGNGIFNMKKRAADIGAQLNIKSRPGEGTTIDLLAPF